MQFAVLIRYLMQITNHMCMCMIVYVNIFINADENRMNENWPNYGAAAHINQAYIRRQKILQQISWLVDFHLNRLIDQNQIGKINLCAVWLYVIKKV